MNEIPRHKWNGLNVRFKASRYTVGESKQVPFAAEGWLRKNSDFAPLTEDEKRALIAHDAEKLLRAQTTDVSPMIEEFV